MFVKSELFRGEKKNTVLKFSCPDLDAATAKFYEEIYREYRLRCEKNADEGLCVFVGIKACTGDARRFLRRTVIRRCGIIIFDTTDIDVFSPDGLFLGKNGRKQRFIPSRNRKSRTL